MRIAAILTLCIGCFGASEDEANNQRPVVTRCPVEDVPNIGALLGDDDPELAVADATLATLATIRFPEDLDFTPGKKAEASKLRFRSFADKLNRTSAAAQDHYRQVIESDAPLPSRRRACAVRWQQPPG